MPPDAGPGNVPAVEITFPDGAVLSSSDDDVHAKLSELAGRDVRLTALPPAEDTSLHELTRAERPRTTVAGLHFAPHFGVAEDEKLPDLVDGADLRSGHSQAVTRLRRACSSTWRPVHVLSQTSLATIGAEIGGDLDVRRFRPNVLLALDNPDDGLPESQWTGARLILGEVVLDVTMPTVRCVVPSRAQPGFEVDRRITKAVAARAQRCLGVYCGVDAGGTVRVGDEVAARQPSVAGRKVFSRRRPAHEAA